MAKDIKKIGLSVFSIKVFPYPNFTEKELAYKEKEWILKLNTLKPNGYNQRLPDPEREVNTLPPDFFHEKGKYAGLYESETRCQMCKKRLKGREEGVCFECEPKWWGEWDKPHIICDFCGCDETRKKTVKDNLDINSGFNFCSKKCAREWESLKCIRLFRPQFSKVKIRFVAQIQEVSNILTPNEGVSDDTPV